MKFTGSHHKTMATLFQSFTVFCFCLFFSTVHARHLTNSPEDQSQKDYDHVDVSYSNSKILLPSEKSLDPDPGSVMNIDVDRHEIRRESGKLSDEFKVMPASGSFPGKFIDRGKKRLHKESEIPMMVNWRPINRHLDRMRVIQRSFPVHCRNGRSRLDGGAEIRQRRSPISLDAKDVVEGEIRNPNRRYGKIISASWIDGTTFHRLEAVTIPDIDGEEIMIGEFRSPRFIFHRNLRHHEHRKEAIGHILWEKMRNFLINL